MAWRRINEGDVSMAWRVYGGVTASRSINEGATVNLHATISCGLALAAAAKRSYSAPAAFNGIQL